MPNEKKKYNPAYLRGLSPSEKSKRKKELNRGEKTDSDDPSAYEPSRFKTDFDKDGKRKETKTSKWTNIMNARKKKDLNEFVELDDEWLSEELEVEIELEVLREFIEEAILVEKKKKSNNVTKALKNKAEETGAPVGALRAIYNKGLAAWRTGHRPGATQHAWAMARVNSVLAGGPARKVDDVQWQKIKKHRGKKGKKK